MAKIIKSFKEKQTSYLLITCDRDGCEKHKKISYWAYYNAPKGRRFYCSRDCSTKVSKREKAEKAKPFPKQPSDETYAAEFNHVLNKDGHPVKQIIGVGFDHQER